jgi:general secretion pathway protein B
MSYILEALKKAQAERQLGNAPTIHAPAPSYAAPGAGQGGGRRYLMVGLGVGVVVAAVALLWPRLAGEPAVRLTATADAPVATLPTAASPAVVIPAPAAPVVAPAPAPAPVVAAPPARTQVAPAPVAAKPAPAPAPREPEPVRTAPPAPSPEPAPARVVAQSAGDEQLRTLQQLPDALQREIPKVAFGGYIYSPTPGESLLLVDKMLRREGEEVAPGLVLERLTPKAAVMNYRGTRYRASY